MSAAQKRLQRDPDVADIVDALNVDGCVRVWGFHAENAIPPCAELPICGYVRKGPHAGKFVALEVGGRRSMLGVVLAADAKQSGAICGTVRGPKDAVEKVRAALGLEAS